MGGPTRKLGGGAGGRRGVLLWLTAAAAALVIALGGCGTVTSASGSSAPTQAPSSTKPGTAPKASSSPKPRPSKKPGGARPKPAGAASAATVVTFVDVGQGDAAVIRSGSWAGIVDGGPARSEQAVEAALRRLGVRRLNAVVVSHMHVDHIGGLPALVAEWRPRTAYMAGTPTSALAAALRSAGTSIVQVRRGASLRFGAAKAQVLSPAGVSGDPNSDSVVLLLQASGKRFLFTGDCTGPNEAAVGSICARGPPVDVLKVAHHGSQYSTGTAFLQQARPRIAVISVGPNSYGHPTPATVGRLLAAGVRLYTTWKNGDVTFAVSASGAMSVSFTRSRAAVTSTSDARGGAGSGASTSTSGGSGSASGGTIVYVTRTGECYHRSGCRYLSSSRIPITLREAREKYRPCSVCKPPT